MGFKQIYMYTDFTGNALYSGANDLYFDFTETKGYSDKMEAKGVYFIWESDELTSWKNLELRLLAISLKMMNLNLKK